MAIRINYGIKTGYNDAFYIDGNTRAELIKIDPKSKELIKPLLRGRDIAAYYTKPAEQWLIATCPSLQIKIDRYPAIKNHLLSFGKKKLEQTGEPGSRKKTSNEWFETQDTITYFDAFAEPKIIYPNMTLRFPFMYDESGAYTNDKGFILNASNDKSLLKYLIGVLNSDASKIWIWHNCPALGEDRREIRKVYFEHIPIPPATPAQQKPIVTLVDRILAAKKADSNADTSALESQIDQLVYKLYGLTEEEIAIVEGRGESGAAGVRALPDDGHAGRGALPGDGGAKVRRRGVRVPAAAVEALHSDDDEELE